MKIHPNEMILFYSCEEASHKKTRSYAHSIAAHIREYNFKEYKFSKMIWKDILDMLQLEPKDLLNRADPKYQKEMAGKSFDEESWLEILIKNPCMIKAPIAIMHNKAVLCVNPKEIYKLVKESEINM